MLSITSSYSTTDGGSSCLTHRNIIRSFLHKLLQVIVQSRYGNLPAPLDRSQGWEIIGKEQTMQHVTGVSDGKFHLDLFDNVEITSKFISTIGEWYMAPGSFFTVEILIHTIDNDLFALEMWTVTMLDNPGNAQVRYVDPSLLYTKLSTLLKSVLVASRVTPGYRQSFNQTQNSYVMLYNISTVQPNYKYLGNKYGEHIFSPITCPEGCYRLEVRYRTSYERDLSFNRSILHRDMYYSSLASLTDAANAGFRQQGNVTPQPHQYGSDRHLDRTAGDNMECLACLVDGPMEDDVSTDFNAEPQQQRHCPHHHPAHHHHQLHRHHHTPQHVSSNTRDRGSGRPVPIGSHCGQQQAVSRRISVGVCGQRPIPSGRNSPSCEVVCSSLPTRISNPLPTIPRTPCSPERTSSNSSHHGSTPNIHATLQKSPPTDIPQPSLQPDRVSQSPFDDPPVELPGVYVVPRVTLPPTDLFASIVHGPSVTDLHGSPDNTHMVDSFIASDEEEELEKEAVGDRKGQPIPGSYQDEACAEQVKGGAGSSGEGGLPDFVMVNTTNAAFDKNGKSPQYDLGMFYQACRNAPRLFTSPPTCDCGASDPPTICCCQQQSPVEYTAPVLTTVQAEVAAPQGSVVTAGRRPSKTEVFPSNPQPAKESEDDEAKQDSSSEGPKGVDASPLKCMESRLKQFEDNLEEFSLLMNSLEVNKDSDPA